MHLPKKTMGFMSEENKVRVSFTKTRSYYPRFHQFVLAFWKLAMVNPIIKSGGFLIHDPDSRIKSKTLVSVSLNFNPNPEK